MSRPPVPACGAAQIVRFLKDPALFTGGPGLRIGDVYRVRLPGHRLHVVTDPELVERILVRDADRFRKGRVYWKELRRTMGDAMGSLDGERWSYLYGIERPFFTPRAVEGHLPLIDRLVSARMAALDRRLASDPGFPVLEAFSELNAAVVLSSLFGQEDSEVPPGVVERIADGNRILDWMSRFPWRHVTARFNGVARRIREHRAFFDAYVGGLRASARGDGHLLEALGSVGSDPSAPPFSPSLVRNEIMFHLGASTETLAAAQGWALYLLWKHPDALADLRAEVDAAARGRLVGPDDLPALDFTRRVVQETLRLYPPVYGVVRDAAERVDLGRLVVEPGDTMLISVFGLHRSPRLWTEPERFVPERFEAERARDIGRYEYIPFGAGRHVCTGRHFALPTMTLTVAQFAQRFDWRFDDPDVRPEASPSLKPSGAFRATVSRRA